MVQQNMFPQQVRISQPPQRAAKATQVVHPVNNSKPPAAAAQAGPVTPQSPVPSFPTNVSQSAQLTAQRPGTVHLSGRVGRYIDIKQTRTGKSLAKFTLATVEPYRDESGNWAKRVVWQPIITWDRTAQLVSELIQTGVRVSVEGKYKTREWTDRENNLRTTTELVARQVDFLDAVAAA